MYKLSDNSINLIKQMKDDLEMEKFTKENFHEFLMVVSFMKSGAKFAKKEDVSQKGFEQVNDFLKEVELHHKEGIDIDYINEKVF